MTATFWDELLKELRKGLNIKGHPFRYCTLGTVGLDQLPRLRTIVLRDMDDDTSMNLYFYTDARSKKIMHINENPRVSLLFYHPKKLMQLKIEGWAEQVQDSALLQKRWAKIGARSRKDYITEQPPGTALDNPDNINYLNDENHFCMVRVAPFKIEYLKLKRPNHLRIHFAKENGDWEGEFLVP